MKRLLLSTGIVGILFFVFQGSIQDAAHLAAVHGTGIEDAVARAQHAAKARLIVRMNGRSDIIIAVGRRVRGHLFDHAGVHSLPAKARVEQSQLHVRGAALRQADDVAQAVCTFGRIIQHPRAQHLSIFKHTLAVAAAGEDLVKLLPIGIGQLGKDTPINWTTKVERKKAGPTWTPTAKMHAEYAAAGNPLPAVVPAGPDNPMGLYALYIGRLYAIHGTNANFGIGLRVSHGCVRLRNDDIKFLFENVPVGTRVQFIDEPVKATTEPDGSRYIEVHNPLSTTEAQFQGGEIVPITLTQPVQAITSQSDVDQNVVEQAIQNRSGMPVRLN